MRLLTLLLGILTTAMYAHGASACGYHFGLAGSGFNVVHPRSVSVAMAVRQATDDGLLDVTEAATAFPDLLGIGYRRALGHLRELEGKLARVGPGSAVGESRRFAFVFVQSRLWARYDVQSNGASVQIHTAADDNVAIVLSDESVLNAILADRLAFDTAVDLGLLQIANDPDGKTLSILRTALGIEQAGGK